MINYKFETRRLLAVRPTQTPAGEEIPAQAIIFNAPREVFGEPHWVGDFCSGIFYAALAEDHPRHADLVRINYQQNAVILMYVTDEEARAEVRAYLIREYGEVYNEEVDEELFEEYWRNNFYENFARGETLLKGS